MNRSVKKSVTVSVALAVVVATAFLVIGAPRGGLGQQRSGVSPKATGDTVLSGKYYVRLGLNGQSEIVFDEVRRVALRPEWAILSVVEEENEEVTLIVSRQSMTFLKAWKDRQKKND